MPDSDLVTTLLEARRRDVTSDPRFRRSMQISLISAITAPIWIPIAVCIGGIRLIGQAISGR